MRRLARAGLLGLTLGGAVALVIAARWELVRWVSAADTRIHPAGVVLPAFDVDSLGQVMVRAAVFRERRTLAQVAFDPVHGPGGNQSPAPVAGPPRPAILLVGIAWSAAPVALLDGVPGVDGSRAMQRGDTAGGLRVRRITPREVVMTGYDTTWTLRIRGSSDKRPLLIVMLGRSRACRLCGRRTCRASRCGVTPSPFTSSKRHAGGDPGAVTVSAQAAAHHEPAGRPRHLGDAGSGGAGEYPLPLLKGLAEAHGLSLTEDSAYFRLGPVPAAQPPAPAAAATAQGNTQLFVIHLKHANAPDVAATVNMLYGGSGAFSGAGLSTGTLSDELRRTSAATMAGGAAAPADAAGAPAGGAVIVPDARTNSLLIRTTAANFTLLQDAVAQLDTRPLQVLIEVLIVEARRDKSFSLGADLDLATQDLGNGPLWKVP